VGSIPSSLNGLPYLRQPGGVLSGMSASDSTAVLRSASSQDALSLGVAALQTQMDSTRGISPTSQNTQPTVSASAPSATDVLPGVSAADMPNATQEQSSINNQALLLQQILGLFSVPASRTGPTSMIG